jgi:hypothetical protein
MDSSNPFALIKASDYSDRQINSLWVEMGVDYINAVIEPKVAFSKYILGGKGTGKTHLLRYYSYPVMRLRYPNNPSLEVIADNGFLAIFLRATTLDASRFQAAADVSQLSWQLLFGVYFELRLFEGVLDALIDISADSPGKFNDTALISFLSQKVTDGDFAECRSLFDLRSWSVAKKRHIDHAINNAAFSGQLSVIVPFSLGALCVSLSEAMKHWCAKLEAVPLIYLIDEIENFSVAQQEVVNTLIRYGEGKATFRVTGRLYSRKTFATLDNGEENREGAEFRTVKLDDILRDYAPYPRFAKNFIARRLSELAPALARRLLDPSMFFQDIDARGFYEDAINQLRVGDGLEPGISAFRHAIPRVVKPNDVDLDEIVDCLTIGFPAILQKLNLLLFLKKQRRTKNSITLARGISDQCKCYVQSGGILKGPYATAYGHYANDLFAQICRGSRRTLGVPYAGFDNFVKMSSGNPRNLLVILSKTFETAQFRGEDFLSGSPLSIQTQTEAARQAAKFAFESDSNYGSASESASAAVRRLAELLRAARFCLKIPEVSPLTISFSEADLLPEAIQTINNALNYSLIYEASSGRPDRSTKAINRKIQLNPMLAPRWGLPLARRGDLDLNANAVNAIFSNSSSSQFERMLRSLISRWDGVPDASESSQVVLF